MPNEKTACIDCKAMIENPTRPEYIINATGKRIRPNARCVDCRATYEKIRVGIGQNAGLTVVE